MISEELQMCGAHEVDDDSEVNDYPGPGERQNLGRNVDLENST